jgi:hypothetical protein
MQCGNLTLGWTGSERWFYVCDFARRGPKIGLHLSSIFKFEGLARVQWGYEVDTSGWGLPMHVI